MFTLKLDTYDSQISLNVLANLSRPTAGRDGVVTFALYGTFPNWSIKCGNWLSVILAQGVKDNWLWTFCVVTQTQWITSDSASYIIKQEDDINDKLGGCGGLITSAPSISVIARCLLIYVTTRTATLS